MTEPVVWPVWGMILACGAATYVWRLLGVLLAGRLNPQSPAFEWVSCVAYALVAGLIARIMVLPTGLMAHTALTDRLLACVVAWAAYRIVGRNMFVALVSGLVVFMAAAYWRGVWPS